MPENPHFIKLPMPEHPHFGVFRLPKGGRRKNTYCGGRSLLPGGLRPVPPWTLVPPMLSHAGPGKEDALALGGVMRRHAGCFAAPGAGRGQIRKLHCAPRHVPMYGIAGIAALPGIFVGQNAGLQRTLGGDHPASALPRTNNFCACPTDLHGVPGEVGANRGVLWLGVGLCFPASPTLGSNCLDVLGRMRHAHLSSNTTITMSLAP